MPKEQVQRINECVSEAACEAAAGSDLSIPALEQFLLTGKETWEGAGSGQDDAYRDAAKGGLRTLFRLMTGLLPAKARLIPHVPPEMIRSRIEPMVKGLVQADWQEIALRELTRRTFVLNLAGAKDAVDAELSTGFVDTAWKVLWAYFGDHGFLPAETGLRTDGISGGEYAHVTWTAYQTDDPYSDVVVHEAAHLLHYLKPAVYGLRVRRGQERFVDVEFRRRELFAYACEAYSRVALLGARKSRISFAENMTNGAFSFPDADLQEIAGLVLGAARKRNGWRAIREATVAHPIRRRAAAIATTQDSVV